MGLLPYERFEAVSALPPHELARRLAVQIDRPKFWGRWPWDPTDKPFEGHMTGDRFILWSLLKFQRYGLRPVVSGVVEPYPGGSIIRAVLRLHWYAAIVMATIMAILLSLVLPGMLNQLHAGSLGPKFLAFLALVTVPYLLFMFFFWLGARRAKRILVEVARG